MATGMLRTTTAFAAPVAFVAIVGVLLRIAGANAATAALVLNVVVLVSALAFGLRGAIAAALVSTGAFTLFLRPTGSLRIDDVENWVALVSFLFASLIAGGLVTRARAEADEAERRRRELAALYRLSVDLFSASAADADTERSISLALDMLEAGEGGLLDRTDPNRAVWRGAAEPPAVPLDLVSPRIEDDGSRRTIIVPLDRHRAFVAVGSDATVAAAESVAALLVLSLERQAIVAERAQVGALRESDRLKTSVLRAVAHNLSTPMTAMTLSVDALRRDLPASSDVKPRVDALASDLATLRRRIENLLSMARIEAGVQKPRPEPVPVEDLIRGVREHLAIIAPDRELQLQIDHETPDMKVDPSLALEIVVNLVDNAHRVSPGGSPVVVAARGVGDSVELTIADEGPGFDDDEPLAERSTGLGLQIARAFTEAHGGSLRFDRRTGGGTVAHLRMPAASLETES